MGDGYLLDYWHLQQIDCLRLATGAEHIGIHGVNIHNFVQWKPEKIVEFKTI